MAETSAISIRFLAWHLVILHAIKYANNPLKFTINFIAYRNEIYI